MKKESPVEKFPGHVIMPDYLNLSQVRAFENALGDMQAVLADKDEGDTIVVSVLSSERLPVVLQCVVEWHLAGVPGKPTLETFPMTPIVPANDLVSWLFGELRDIWIGEIADPKN